jgi:hypothetical protein
MAVFPEEAGRANDNVQAVNTGLDRDLGIAHVAADVCQDLGLQAELADGFAVPARLLGRGRRSQLNVVDAEFIEGLGNLDLGLGVEVGVGELLALCSGGQRGNRGAIDRRLRTTQSRLDNLELVDIGQEVAHGLVWARPE